jgi:hypothetical protein
MPARLWGGPVPARRPKPIIVDNPTIYELGNNFLGNFTEKEDYSRATRKLRRPDWGAVANGS